MIMPWGPDRDALVRSMRGNGSTAREIAAAISASQAFVEKELRRLGLANRRSVLKIIFTAEQDVFIAGARNAKPPLPWVHIKAHIGMSMDTIRARAIELGVIRFAPPKSAPPLLKADDLRHNRLPLPAGSPETWGAIAQGYAYPRNTR